MSADVDIRLMLAGDVMTGRGIDQAFARHCPPQLFEPWVRDAREYLRMAERENGALPLPIGPDYVWGDALAELERARPDFRIVNLETAVTLSDRHWPGKCIHYRMHPANVDLLAAARIDCCVLANNHVMDWGREGLGETLRTLAAAGVATAGAGEDASQAGGPAIFPLAGGGRLLVFGRATTSSGVPAAWAAGAGRAGVALIACADGGGDGGGEAQRDPGGTDPGAGLATPQDADALADQILSARRPGDLVVVSLHWGENWVPRVPGAHRDFARRLIDAGAADIVHGHSSHHPLPIEVHRGRPILYGCGDLVNDYEGIGPRGDLRSDLGCLYLATLARSSGELRALRIVPMQLRRFRLSRPDARAQRWLAQLLEAGCSEFGTALQPDPEGGWRLRWTA